MRRTAALATVVVVLLGAGCSGGDRSASNVPAQLVVGTRVGDRAEFLTVSIDPNDDALAIESFRVNLNTPWFYAIATAPGVPEFIRFVDRTITSSKQLRAVLRPMIGDAVARELRADAYAMRRHPDGDLHLARALYTLSAPIRWAVAPPVSAVPFAALHLLAIRTAAIAGRPYVKPPLPRRSIVGSVAGCIVAAALLVSPPHAEAVLPPACIPSAPMSGSVQQSASPLERGPMTPSTTFASYAFTQAPAQRR